jgi:hypothetical protein
MDMEGRILHEWASPLGKEDGWHHVEPGTNGDLFALVKDSLLLKLNWESELQWATNIAAHHDVAVAENGDLFALTRRTVRIPYPPGDLPLLVDFITVLSPDGKVRAEHSLLDYFADRITESQKRKIANLVEKSPKYESKIVESSLFDVFHANSVEILDRDWGALFRKGQVLVSLLMLNTVAVLDLERKTVVWSWGEGVLEWQHHPTLLPDGNMLIFDNGTHKKFSRIVELDPVRREIAWTYQAEPKESFFSGSRGGNQGLPNGNVLITESDRGRAFEVTRQGETVWEFYNPDTQQGSKGEAPRRAAIYRLMRYDDADLRRFGLDRRGIRTPRP